uniref:Uncharacterized protein n=1 Tax=Rhizophora mucronata TaxID=61149 RepID=A0A2P2J5P9_RHIMU
MTYVKCGGNAKFMKVLQSDYKE